MLGARYGHRRADRALVSGIVNGGQAGWSAASTLAAFGLAAVLLAAFGLIEARLASEPLVPLRVYEVAP